eukprot:6387730-Pyramimonas_sp.AAC.1
MEAPALAQAARSRGLRLHVGEAVEGEHLLAAAHSPTCCAARAATPLGLSGRHPGRLQHVALHFGGSRAMHCMNCYGYAGGRRDAEANADLVMEGIEWLHGLGEVPALL